MASIALSAVASSFAASASSALGFGATSFGASLLSGVFDTAAGLVGGALDNAIFGGPPKIHGPRLSELSVQTSTYGKTIPIMYGTARIAGNVIWARDIKEVATTSSVGGGKGGIIGGGGIGGGQQQVTYAYYATLAIAICEGPIDEVSRVWADAGTVDPSQASANYNLYYGSEDQMPDPIMEGIEGVGEVPAYRGMAYVVIEDFPLAEYGNRIPNFTFEVKRKVLSQTQTDQPVEEMIGGMVMIPGSGEFVYDTVVQTKVPGSYVGGTWVQQGNSEKINQHNFSDKADVLVALDQLEDTCPNLEWVALVVTWFGNSIDAGDCTIFPAVEYKTGAITQPDAWSVAGFNRDTATEISQDVGGNPVYGGTPSDSSVVRLLQEIKNRGKKVMFYPLVFMDVAGKPWRGRITGTPAEVSDFFTKTDGYNEFINHYANLAKDYIDAFVIGSEMKGLTSVQDVDDSFPAVDELISLAATVKSIVGSSVKVTYAADWSEYHHEENGWYNLDPLWASANIDFVGIDAYFPLTDEPQNGYDHQKIIDGWTSGEGYDWIYTDPERTIQEPIAEEYAWKNIQWWWENEHVNPDMSTTAWVPESKKIWFTEVGYPSLDGAANQPNVFYDPNSTESGFPYHSRGRIDFRAQRQCLTGTMLKWNDSSMIENMFVWTWDARPFSFWPDLTEYWHDGELWKFGHWTQGKLGMTSLAGIIEDLTARSGLPLTDIDVMEITNLVRGYVLTNQETARDAISSLRAAYFFDAVESDNIIKFVPRGGETALVIDESELEPQDKDNSRELIAITRGKELDLPKKIDINYISNIADYQLGNQHSQRQVIQSLHVATMNLSVVLSDQEAKSIADIAMYNMWVERTKYSFTLPLTYADLEATDIIQIDTEDASHTIRVTGTHYGKPGRVQVQGVAEDISVYDFYNPPGETGGGTGILEDGGDTSLDLLDLPTLPSADGTHGTMHFAMAGFVEAWEGATVFRSDDGGGNYFQLLSITSPTVKGTTENALGGTDFPNNFDNGNSVTVILLGGELSSTTMLGVLNGANAAVVGNEIIQFTNATLLEPNKYELSGLLRGRLGTEDQINTHIAGERFVLLDSGVPHLDMPNGLINLPRKYKAVTVGQTLAETAEQNFTFSANALRPLAPVHISGERDISEDLTINWIRRTRVGGEWQDYVDAQLGEASELYEVDILDGVEVVRTFTGLTSPTVTYTASEQIDDFGGTQASVDVKIFQISSVLGRGRAGVAAV